MPGVGPGIDREGYEAASIDNRRLTLPGNSDDGYLPAQPKLDEDFGHVSHRILVAWKIRADPFAVRIVDEMGAVGTETFTHMYLGMGNRSHLAAVTVQFSPLQHAEFARFDAALQGFVLNGHISESPKGSSTPARRQRGIPVLGISIKKVFEGYLNGLDAVEMVRKLCLRGGSAKLASGNPPAEPSA